MTEFAQARGLPTASKVISAVYAMMSIAGLAVVALVTAAVVVWVDVL
jgi:hypothetical protein